MSCDPTITCRHVAMNIGGVAPTTSNVRTIGTRGCLTCVGLYFPNDKDRCFTAHINAFIEPNNFISLISTARDLPCI